MANNFGLRGNRFIWAMRIVQCVVAIAVLVFAIMNTIPWRDSECSLPRRIAWNFACAVITIAMSLVLLFTTGLAAKWGFGPPWTQLPVDGLFLLFWILATALSPMDCGDMCDMCGGSPTNYALLGTYDFRVQIEGTTCYCNDGGAGSLDKRAPRASSSSSYSSGGGSSPMYGYSKKGWAFLARQSLDGVMIFLFLVTLITGIWLYFRGPRSSSSSSHALPGAAPAAASEHIPGVPVEEKDKIAMQTYTGETDVAGNPIYRTA